MSLKEKGEGLLLPARDIAPQQGDWNKLTPKQRKFLISFSSEQSVNMALKKAKVSRGSYDRWGNDDNFRAVFSLVQTNIIASAQMLAQQEALNSVRKILDLRDNGDGRTALDAAKTALKIAADPTLTGANKLEASREVAWMKLLEKLTPAVQHISDGGDYVDAEYEKVDKPAFTDTKEDESTMAELEAKAKYQRLTN